METQAPGLVVLNGRLWVTPINPHMLQCVARTTKGPRCRNLISDGQVLSWAEPQLSGHGYVRAYDGRRFEETERWLAQHCRTHDSQDQADAEAPEFRPFHLVHDATLVRPYRYDVLFDGELEAAR